MERCETVQITIHNPEIRQVCPGVVVPLSMILNGCRRPLGPPAAAIAIKAENQAPQGDQALERLAVSYSFTILLAPSTSPSVIAAITTSPSAPTTNGLIPCFFISLKLIRRPTPASVSRKAERDRSARLFTWSLLKTLRLASSEISRNPSTNLGNFCHRNVALLPTACRPSRAAQYSAYPSTTKPIMALRVVLASTAIWAAAWEYSAPAATASAVLSTPVPAHRPYTRSLIPSQCPIGGKVNRASAPSARIAAIAKDASSSSASIAPLVAIIAETPQIDDPTASRLVNLGLSLKMRPSSVIKPIDKISSINTSVRLTAPSLSTSATRKRAPSRTIPVFSQNSYVAIPGLNISATPTVFEISNPIRIAHRTYSIDRKSVV